MNIRQGLEHGRILPAVKHISDLSRVLPLSRASIVIVLGGSINELPEIQRVHALHPEKLLFMHVDLLEGIGKDAEGIRFLRRFGIHGIVSVKSHLLKYAKDSGFLTVQRLFLLDSESLTTGLKQMKKNLPDAIEILPAVVPEFVISEFKQATDRPLFTDLGGELMIGARALSLKGESTSESQAKACQELIVQSMGKSLRLKGKKFILATGGLLGGGIKVGMERKWIT